jgi:nicotinate-nucleotide pyrophosphorylase
MSLDHVQNIISEIKTQWPQINLIVIVEDTAQAKEVEESEVDSVLLRGFPAQKLVAIVENFIDCRENNPPVQAPAKGKTITD